MNKPKQNIIRIYLIEKGLLILFSLMAGIALVFSTLIFFAENGNNSANIHSFSSAVWWAFSTMTTACYGDVYPTTAIGKVLAVSFLFISIALIAVFTAHFTAAILSKENDELKAKLTNVESELKSIRELLEKK